jgi:competence transcription factor ComK
MSIAGAFKYRPVLNRNCGVVGLRYLGRKLGGESSSDVEKKINVTPPI